MAMVATTELSSKGKDISSIDIKTILDIVTRETPVVRTDTPQNVNRATGKDRFPVSGTTGVSPPATHGGQSERAENVSQESIAPDSIPLRNHRTRCAALPCVNDSGAT